MEKFETPASCVVVSEDILDFTLDYDGEEKGDHETILKSATDTAALGHGTRGGSVPDFAAEEEELEWLSNKDAFPSIETCFDILSDNLVSNHQYSPISVLENTNANSNNGSGSALVVPTNIPLQVQRSRRGRKRKTNCSESSSSVLPPDLTSASGIVRKKCLHCQADKTPQWQAGPMGPSTLCNACGMRYKSGCLLPEYRPVNSPTISKDFPVSVLENTNANSINGGDSALVVPTNIPLQVQRSRRGRKRKANCGESSSSVLPPDLTSGSGIVRTCLHCQADKTPQWQAGPMGPSTLCNACGMRYKSGCLLPEYRPVNSPTISKDFPVSVLENTNANSINGGDSALVVPTIIPLQVQRSRRRRKRKTNCGESSSSVLPPDLTSGSGIVRKTCLHCQADQTPQWRAGPMGPSTLCNACGMRYYKSGCLLPEYRPVYSPTISKDFPVSVLENTNANSINDGGSALVVPTNIPLQAQRSRRGRKRKTNCGKSSSSVLPPDLTSGSGIVRKRCLHCQADKAPQWRAGPMGPNTLCNACGVRYRSGRLLPEYRPTNSPTFSKDLHSNSHRKVVAMRDWKLLSP